MAIAGLRKDRSKASLSGIFQGSVIKALRRNSFILIVLIPVSIHFLIFELFPLIFSLYVSFFDWPLGAEPRYIGLKNWMDLFSDPLVGKSLIVTFKFALYYVLPTMVIGLMLAILINTRLKFIGIFKSIYFVPAVTSIVILASVWKWFFVGDSGGIVNYVLGIFGIENLRFFSDENLALLITALLSIFKGCGYLMIYFYAGLKGLPETVFEAARIDGASGWRILWKITLPLLQSTILYIVIVSTIDVLQVFESSYILTAGGPNYATSTIVYQIYRTAFVNMNMGYASSMAYILFVMILIITLIQYKVLNKDVSYT